MGQKSTARRKSDEGVARWKVGALLIIGGVVANVFSPMVMDTFMPPPANRSEAMGRAFGRGLATLMCILAGVVMIIVHFVRRSRR